MKFAKAMSLADSVAKDGIDQALVAANAFAPLAIELGAQKTAAMKWQRAFKEIEGRLAAPMVPVDPSARARKSSPTGAKGSAP
jgi:hypothetical protein